jgi:hypothetical protein
MVVTTDVADMSLEELREVGRSAVIDFDFDDEDLTEETIRQVLRAHSL